MRYKLWYISFCYLLQIFIVNNEKWPHIHSKFLNGSLLLTWTKSSTFDHDVMITTNINTTDWIRVKNPKYVVKDVLNFTFVSIRIREYRSSDLKNHVESNNTFKVEVIKCKEGDSTNISWTVDYFPATGHYYIYHTYADNISKIIAVVGDDARFVEPFKYIFFGKDNDSHSIKFAVTNITTADAGYYTGGVSEYVASSYANGVVLLVQGKLTKPVITGNLTYHIGGPAYFRCSSNSTSAPFYYKKFPPLLYFWYVNDTRLSGISKEKYRFTIAKKDRYNRISCTAKEGKGGLESVRSEDLHVDVLYGPDEKQIWISPPPPPDDRLCVQDGGIFGPFNCTADCNPPCMIQWKNKIPTGEFANATSLRLDSQIIPERRVEKGNVTLFQCVVKWSSGKDDGYKTRNLDIQFSNCNPDVSATKQYVLAIVGSLITLFALLTTVFVCFKITHHAQNIGETSESVQTKQEEYQNNSEVILDDDFSQGELYEEYDNGDIQGGGRNTNCLRKNNPKIILNHKNQCENKMEEQGENNGYQYQDIHEEQGQFYTPLNPVLQTDQ
ncbi:uncharacterized protein LOC134261835 isoform X2 [Saccostrea cucullata]|uniref:uncharacterized protein LOC134261835 isoform X2 n=1 Tax=Saccostrea cuccullata TaxID=36930 RepID=UPI002ED32D6F